MTVKYRTDDLGQWGSGIGRNLLPAEVDQNFWDVVSRIVVLEGQTFAPVNIDHFEVSGTQFYVHMDDGTTILGPYDLPIATFRARGAWTPSTSYSVLDTVTANGNLYAVIFAHTSALTFDENANDGSGHDYYSLMLQ